MIKHKKKDLDFFGNPQYFEEHVPVKLSNKPISPGLSNSPSQKVKTFIEKVMAVTT